MAGVIGILLGIFEFRYGFGAGDAGNEISGIGVAAVAGCDFFLPQPNKLGLRIRENDVDDLAASTGIDVS